MRTYLNTLLHRKRGEYGPLWLFELDAETWAIVWSGWLENEDLCHAILAEDPQLFNREWGADGRRPNPTYKTQGAALEEAVRLLHAMKADLDIDDSDQKKYALYISVAEHDLHQPASGQQQGAEPAQQNADQAPASVVNGAWSSTGDLFAAEATSPSIFQLETVASTDPHATGTKKPWEEYAGPPKSVHFQPLDDAHAKMEWVCDNVPKMSRLRLVREAVDMFCDQLIQKYYQR